MKIVKGLSLFLLLAIVSLFTSRALRVPQLELETLNASALLSYDPEFNYRQTINDCGPFNTAAVVRVLKKDSIDSKNFAETIEWRLPNGYTLPWGLEKQLKENEIETITPHLGSFSDQERVAYLKQELSKGSPIIILGGRDDYVGKNYEHYVTLLGFDSAEGLFYAYDPFFPTSTPGMTEDANGLAPGNRSYKTEVLLEFWEKGGVLGFYEWYALVAVGQ